ncbi:MAG TPA: carbohydrate porin [Bryobacteraceae bacterium]|nr:carbohydrate porin [Bryobacteraceae bacterium]
MVNRALSQAGLLPYGSEKAVEVNYSLHTRWFSCQPVFQYYFDTGANPYSRNNTVCGFRTTFTL